MTIQDMVQELYDSLTKLNTLNHFRHASDTTGTRQAGYVVYVKEINNVYSVVSGYGRLGTNYRYTEVAAYGNLSSAIQRADDIIQAKLNKNYVEDTSLIVKGRISPSSNAKTLTISVSTDDFPDETQAIITSDTLHNENVYFEWYPNRMRMKYMLLRAGSYEIYNISGILETGGNLPEGFSPTPEYMKMALNGLLFLCYEDPNGNYVLLKYLRNFLADDKIKGYSYQKQRLITEMVMDELIGSNSINITSSKLPIYLNPCFCTASEKENMARKLEARSGLNKFATNLVIFQPVDDMERLYCVGR